MAQMLSRVGVYFGPEENLLEPNEFNRHGYMEDKDLVDINSRILDLVGAAWDHPPKLGLDLSAASSTWSLDDLKWVSDMTLAMLARLRAPGCPWGMKDPRLSLTLPYFRAMVPDLATIVMVRNPLGVYNSLLRRGQSIDDFYSSMWLVYYQHINFHTPTDRIVVHMGQLFDSPEFTIRRVLGYIGHAVPDADISAAAALVDRADRHFWVSNEELAQVCKDESVLRMYADLCAEAGYSKPANEP
jgi:hypothetical protein